VGLQKWKKEDALVFLGLTDNTKGYGGHGFQEYGII
jgi:hypothetical protein